MTDSIMTPERLDEIGHKQQLAADWQSVELDLNLSLVRNEIPELIAALRASQARESAMMEALGKIAGKNDLSGVADDMIESAARNALFQCELLAREAIEGAALTPQDHKESR